MKFLPCPFCGGLEQQVIEELSDSEKAYLGCGLAVYCECGAQGAVGFTEEEAIALWNARKERSVEVFVLSAYYESEVLAVFDSREKVERAKEWLISKYYPNEIHENIKYKFEIKKLELNSDAGLDYVTPG